MWLSNHKHNNTNQITIVNTNGITQHSILLFPLYNHLSPTKSPTTASSNNFSNWTHQLFYQQQARLLNRQHINRVVLPQRQYQPNLPSYLPTMSPSSSPTARQVILPTSLTECLSVKFANSFTKLIQPTASPSISQQHRQVTHQKHRQVTHQQLHHQYHRKHSPNLLSPTALPSNASSLSP